MSPGANLPPPTGGRAGAGRRWLRSSYRASAGSLCLLIVSLFVFEAVVRVRDYPAAALEAGHAGSIRIRDKDGVLLREATGRNGHRAEWRRLDEISPLVASATVAVEDARFWQHNGIDHVGVLRSAYANLTSGRIVQGASTLTMQLARLIRPHGKSVRGKLGEMVDARRIERAADKRTILEQYLNRAPYGAGTIGVEAASQRYFGKPSAHLSLAEAALIAGLPKAPTLLNPLVNPERARERQRWVLRRMLATSAITKAEYDRALAEPLRYRSDPPPLGAMHFGDLVLARHAPPGGGDLITTLDSGLQGAVEASVREHVRSLALGGVTNAAVVVIENERCRVRAMVGSSDYWRQPDGAVNGALALRQPGSTLKPFTYALAFERGDSPASVVADVPTHYPDADGNVFAPQNFNKAFSGPVLLGAALARSLNVPAVRVANRVGVDRLLERLRAAGFESLAAPAGHYGLGLTLGNGEVTLLELAQGYAAFARGGLSCRAQLLEGAQAPQPERIFSEKVSFLITSILADEGLRVSAFGPANALMLGFPVAVKTGTSSNWRDSWAVGYTSRYTVAVWTGDFGGHSMNHLAGATGAGPLFHNVMKLVTMRDGPRHRPTSPEPPAGVEQISVCAHSGKRLSKSCPHHRQVWVDVEHAPSETCDWHTEIAVDERNGLRAGPTCPERFVQRRAHEILPPEYAEWQAEQGTAAAPLPYSPLCPAEGPAAGAIAITHPRPGDVFLIEPGYDRRLQSVELRAQSSAPAARVVWKIDGTVVARTHWPYRARWPLTRGRHTLTAEAPGQIAGSLTFEVR